MTAAVGPCSAILLPVLARGELTVFPERRVEGGLGVEARGHRDIEYGAVAVPQCSPGGLDAVTIHIVEEILLPLLVDGLGEIVGGDSQLLRELGQGESTVEVGFLLPHERLQFIHERKAQVG